MKALAFLVCSLPFSSVWPEPNVNMEGRVFSIQQPLRIFELRFLSKSTFHLTASAEGCVGEENGTYESRNQTLFFQVPPCAESSEDAGEAPRFVKFCFGSQNYCGLHDKTCSFAKGLDSAEYDVFLFCSNGLIFPEQESAIKPCSIKRIKGIETIITGRRIASTTAPVFFRDAPSRTGRSITYYGPPYSVINFKVIPSGQQIQTLGHTCNRETINGVTGYWYLTEGTGEFLKEWGFQGYGWVFGGYLQFPSTEH